MKVRFFTGGVAGMAVLAALFCATVSVSAQTVLYSTDFDGPESAVVPEGWTQVPGSLHEPGSEDPDFDWKAVNSQRFSILDPDSGDQVRDIMGYFRRDPFAADGSPLLDFPIGSIDALERPPLSGSVQWERMSGSRAPWKNPPYFTMGEQPDGTYPETARVLVADSDEYGGANMNLAIDSPPIALQDSNWVRIRYESFLTANQDQSAGNWYKLDDGPWEPLVFEDNYSHGNDQAYAGPYSFAINTQGASTLQLRWWFAGDFSWFWAIDDLEVTGYTDVPPGPAKPSVLEPQGSVALADLTRAKSSAYSDSTGGMHVFSEWEVRHEGGTYGNFVLFNEEEFLLDMPVLRTSIQPNEFALNAVNPDDLRGSNDMSARSEEPPYEPILFGREQPGAQFEIDLLGDHTVLNLPEHLFKPGETYYIRVRHWNNDGLAGPWSDEVQFSVKPVAAQEILFEDFDGDDVLARVESAGWIIDWVDIPLWLLQIHGDDLNSLNDTETDGRGMNGHFSGGVLHAQDDYLGIVMTPPIDNSNGGPLTLVFDSAWRTDVTGEVRVAINGAPTSLLEIGDAYIVTIHPEYGDGAPGDQIIYQNTYVLPVPEAAGQANVRFEFEMFDGTWWTIDNVSVREGEPAAVESWSVR